MGSKVHSVHMDTDPSSYTFVNRNEDVLPLYDIDVGDKRSTPVEYVVCSDCVDGKGQTLNEEYRANEDMVKFSPEIGVYQIDGVDGALESGTIRIEVHDDSGQIVGEREEDVSNLGHTIQPGYGIVPYVKVDEGVRPKDISEVRIFIVDE